MATTNLGKVSVTPKGEYDPLITYERLDIVSHNGSSYIVKQASTGVTPIEGEFYALIAEKGDGGSFVKKAYKTYAAMDADKVNIPENSSVDVTNDPDESKNGAYIYDGVAFTRSQYDSKVVTDKIIADTAIAVQDAINNTVISSGFVTVDSFELGATITQRNEALRHTADGKLYRWAGDLPKVVPASSTPASSGGISANAWLEVSDAALRQQLASPTGEQFVGGAVGYVNSVSSLLDKPFEVGKTYVVTDYNGKKGGGTYKWDAAKPKISHNGVSIISPTVPKASLQDESLVISLNATKEQAQDFLFRKGQGETDVNGLGAWVSNDAKYPVKLPKNIYTIPMSHLPKANEKMYIRRTVSSGQYLFVLTKGAYAVSSEFSYLSIFSTPKNSAPKLLSWVQVGDVPEDFRELVLYKDYLYVIPFGSTDKKFTIYNVKDRTNPIYLGQSDMRIGSTNGVGKVVGNIMYIHTWGGAGLYSYDLSNPRYPEKIAGLSGGVSGVQGSMICYDKRGYMWGALYDVTASEGTDSLVRYTISSGGEISNPKSYSFAGVTAIRRMAFSNDKLYMGRFNQGIGVFEINIDNPNSPVLQKTYSDMSVGDIVLFDDSILGSRNTPNSDFSMYSYNDTDKQYNKHILYNKPLSLAENHYQGVVGFANNGLQELDFVYLDYGYDGAPYEQSEDYLIKESSQFEVGRGAGKLLAQGTSEGDAIFDSVGDSKISLRAKNRSHVVIDSATNKTSIFNADLVHDNSGAAATINSFRSSWGSAAPALIGVTPIDVVTFDVTGLLSTSIELTVFSRRKSTPSGSSLHKVYLSWSGSSAETVIEKKTAKISAGFGELTFSAVTTDSTIKLQVSCSTVSISNAALSLQIAGCYNSLALS